MLYGCSEAGLMQLKLMILSGDSRRAGAADRISRGGDWARTGTEGEGGPGGPGPPFEQWDYLESHETGHRAAERDRLTGSFSPCTSSLVTETVKGPLSLNHHRCQMHKTCY